MIIEVYYCDLRQFSFFLFMIWLPFISFSLLIALARNSGTMLNRSIECEPPCLVSVLRGRDFSFSLI